jgi:hypothetical protein
LTPKTFTLFRCFKKNKWMEIKWWRLWRTPNWRTISISLEIIPHILSLSTQEESWGLFRL